MRRITADHEFSIGGFDIWLDLRKRRGNPLIEVGDRILWGIEAREYCGHAAKTLRQIGQIVKPFRCYVIPEDVESSGCHNHWMIKINDSRVMHQKGLTEGCSEVITDREDRLTDGVVNALWIVLPTPLLVFEDFRARSDPRQPKRILMSQPKEAEGKKETVSSGRKAFEDLFKK